MESNLMLKQIIHQLWNRRRSNGWLFAELFIVFVLLWYCLDILYGFAYNGLQPKGYDIRHVYQVIIRANPTQLPAERTLETLQTQWLEPQEEILRRIRQYPGVESAAMWMGSDAYTRHTMYQGYTLDSVKVQLANIRYVSAAYFDVMRIPLQAGQVGEWEASIHPTPAVITSDMADSLFHTTADVVGREIKDYYDGGFRYRIAGVCDRQKEDDYTRYEPFILTPLPRWLYNTYGYTVNYCFRVRPEMDTPDFADRFYRAMTPQLQVAAFYLFEVNSYAAQKIERDAAEGVTPYIRGAELVVVFFAFNVFIGLLGTFWFRTRYRRSEIALRMAMGSSRARIRTQLIGEGLLLLLAAALPALVVCFNLVVADVTITSEADATPMRFWIVFTVTLLFMALMVLLGIGFPAQKAMQIQPAEALHED
ncbi:MAG: ABC transporter permease [Prevotellaceae bacterium]|jgi:putative ABC transport system permease protein|nr:ABC transporter permease [Prevotellaceae bacterium]